MDNFNRPGETLTLTAPVGNVVSGSPYQVGNIVVIATADVVAGLPFEGLTVGVVDVPKVADEVWTELQRIYFDSSEAKFTEETDTGANPLVGVAVGNVDATVEVDAIENVGSDGLTVDGLVITVTDYLELAGASVTITVGGVTTTLVEDALGSADWEAETSNDATATSLAAAINAIAGVAAAAVAADITIVAGSSATGADPAIGRVRLDGAAR
jgi:predicted RecA/RadA family phage recombinase